MKTTQRTLPRAPQWTQAAQGLTQRAPQSPLHRSPQHRDGRNWLRKLPPSVLMTCPRRSCYKCLSTLTLTTCVRPPRHARDGQGWPWSHSCGRTYCPYNGRKVGGLLLTMHIHILENANKYFNAVSCNSNVSPRISCWHYMLNGKVDIFINK